MTGFNQEVDKFYSLIEQGKASSFIYLFFSSVLLVYQIPLQAVIVENRNYVPNWDRI